MGYQEELVAAQEKQKQADLDLQNILKAKGSTPQEQMNVAMQSPGWMNALGILSANQQAIADKKAQQEAASATLKDIQTQGDINTQVGRQINQAEEAGRQGLAQQIAGVKQGAQSRGLLYSGIKQQDVAGATNQYAAQLANAAAQYKQQGVQKMNQYRGQQANAGLDEYQLAQQRAASDYQTALQKRKTALQQKSAGAQTGAAIGSAVGLGAGFI